MTFHKRKRIQETALRIFQKKIHPEQLAALKQPIEIAKANSEESFFINKKPIFAKSNNRLFPTLISGRLLANIPRATETHRCQVGAPF